MNNPGDQDIGWGKVLQINVKLAFGALILCYGWLCWQGVSAKWWGLWLLAMLCFIGGAVQIIGAAFEAIKLISRLRHWRKYQRLGAELRADRMAQDHDFASHSPKNGGSDI